MTKLTLSTDMNVFIQRHYVDEYVYLVTGRRCQLNCKFLIYIFVGV